MTVSELSYLQKKYFYFWALKIDEHWWNHAEVQIWIVNKKADYGPKHCVQVRVYLKEHHSVFIKLLKQILYFISRQVGYIISILFLIHMLRLLSIVKIGIKYWYGQFFEMFLLWRCCQLLDRSSSCSALLYLMRNESEFNSFPVDIYYSKIQITFHKGKNYFWTFQKLKSFLWSKSWFPINGNGEIWMIVFWLRIWLKNV